MKVEISVVIATYNRLNSLKKVIDNIIKTLDGLDYEIVVSDNASTDGTKDYFDNLSNNNIRYYRNQENIGYFKNFLNGLEKATSEVVWVCCDDDDIGERSFFEEGLRVLKNSEADLVFGRLKKRATIDSSPDSIDKYNFQEEYSSKEYLSDWLNIRERLSSACFLYKRELFIKAHKKFLNLPFHGGTIDYALHYYIIQNSSKIKFIDKTAYVWTISQNDSSVSGESRSDLMWYMMNVFAFPLAYFSPKKDYDLEFFNKYILYGVNALVSSYRIGRNDIYFEKVLNWINRNNLSEYYIFGKGEVGMMLYDYLQKKEVNIQCYIDDMIESEDCILSEDFFKKYNKDGIKRGIIVATYKYEIERKIMKKLLNSKADNIEVLTLVDVVEED